MTPSDQLLSDFIDDWNAGRRPRVRAYLARLPDDASRDELAERIDQWLQIAPTPDYAAARDAIRVHPAIEPLLAPGQANGGWATALPRLRQRSSLSFAALAAGLVDRLDLQPDDAPRAADYLERLESGRLDPARLSRRLLDTLGALLNVSADWLADLTGPGPRPGAPAGVLLRSDRTAEHDPRGDIELLSRAALTPAPTPTGELDRLFTGGRDG